MAANSANAPFHYQLPFDRIAQRPVQPPESAKMLVLAPHQKPKESCFNSLPELLRSGDMLVFNHTRVSPARLRGTIEGKSESAIEFLLVEEQGDTRWRCLAKPLKKLESGIKVLCGEHLIATVEERVGEKEILISFSTGDSQRSVSDLINQQGEMPIPPYIRKGKADEQDRLDYQSIFAEVPGSIAAPTASLHFSEILIKNLEERGVSHKGVILHLGTASFLPIFSPTESDIIRPPGVEHYFHSNILLEDIARTRAQGGRVFAVGTSVVRAIESMVREKAAEGEERQSELFIQPGFEFLALDGIITNFHQPGTTHLLLVEAFIGGERLAEAYDFALTHEFRFLSYGDGMILLPG